MMNHLLLESRIANAIEEYFSEEYEAFCRSANVQCEFYDDSPAYLPNTKVHIDNRHDEATSIFLDALIETLLTRCAGALAKTEYQKKDYHETLQTQLKECMRELSKEKN